MKNTFTGAVLAFSNKGIHAICNEVIKFRKQLMLRTEFRSQSGWNDSLNDYMKDQLEHLAQTVKRVTYSPSGTDPAAVKDQRIAEAKDTSSKLSDAFDGKSINSDDLVMPAATLLREIAYDLSGAHPDVRQPTVDIVENDWGRDFVTNLDAFFVAATNLDSRTQPATINAMESAQLLAMLNENYAICELKGGEANRSETPTGVMASDRPGTFNADGSFDINPADPAQPNP